MGGLLGGSLFDEGLGIAFGFALVSSEGKSSGKS